MTLIIAFVRIKCGWLKRKQLEGTTNERYIKEKFAKHTDSDQAICAINGEYLAKQIYVTWKRLKTDLHGIFA